MSWHRTLQSTLVNSKWLLLEKHQITYYKICCAAVRLKQNQTIYNFLFTYYWPCTTSCGVRKQHQRNDPTANVGKHSVHLLRCGSHQATLPFFIFHLNLIYSMQCINKKCKTFSSWWWLTRILLELKWMFVVLLAMVFLGRCKALVWSKSPV